MSRSECSWTLSLKWMVSCKKEATMCCCFPLILFFPFENLIVYFASEYSLYHVIFSLFCCKDTETSENEQDKWRKSDSPEIFYSEISDSPEIWWLIKSTNSKIFSFLFVDLFFFVYLYHRIAKWIRRWCFPLPIYIIRKRNEDCKGIIWRTE